MLARVSPREVVAAAATSDGHHGQPPLWRNAMKPVTRTMLFLFAIALINGCASTTVTQQTPMVNENIERPNQIWVYDFVASPSDIPADSALSGAVGAPSTPPTDEQLAT